MLFAAGSWAIMRWHSGAGEPSTCVNLMTPYGLQAIEII
jgi:hypothetical protein